jgi:hypothetical protein
MRRDPLWLVVFVVLACIVVAYIALGVAGAGGAW